MTQLLPCPSCARHVRQTETGCPFCGTSLSLADVPGRAVPTQRLARAATFAFGAAIATSVAACGGGTTPGNDAGGVVPLYGAPNDAGYDASTLAMYGGPTIDAGSDAGGPGPLYGAPTIDAGSDAGGPAPAYGAVPAPDAAT
jgi:hypothetical protein